MNLTKSCVEEDYAQIDEYIAGHNLNTTFLQACNIGNLNAIKYIGNKLKDTDDWIYYPFYKTLTANIVYHRKDWETLNYILYGMPAKYKILIKNVSFLIHLLNLYPVSKIESYLDVVRISLSNYSKEELLLKLYNNPDAVKFIVSNNLLPQSLQVIIEHAAMARNLAMVKQLLNISSNNITFGKSLLIAFSYLGDYELFEWAFSQVNNFIVNEEIAMYAVLGGNVKILEKLECVSLITYSIFGRGVLSYEAVEYVLEHNDVVSREVVKNLDYVVQVSNNVSRLILGLSVNVKEYTLVNAFQPENRLAFIEPQVSTKITPNNWKSKFGNLCRFEINASKRFPPIKRKLENIQVYPLWKSKMMAL